MKDFFGGCLLSIIYLIIGLSIPVLIFLFFNFTTGGWYLLLEGMSKEQLEIIDKLGAVVFPGIAIAVPVAIVLLYRRSRKRRKEIMRKADENNTFITARLVEKVRVIKNRKGRQWDYSCTYEYTLNGRVRKHHIGVYGQPPEELRLYPKRENGNKFFSNIGSDQPAWLVIPLGCLLTIIMLFWTIVMWNIVTVEIEDKDRETKYYREDAACFFIDRYDTEKTRNIYDLKEQAYVSGF